MMKFSKPVLLLTLLFAWTISSLNAQSVDTIAIFSPSMNKSVKNVIVLPAGYDPNAAEPYPVIYLLHGYSGCYNSWIGIRPELPQDANRLRCIFVCPDGGYDSWYWDSPKVKDYRYETYVSKELIDYIDSHYNTLKDRTGRAISGNSMGGHGALWLAIRHNDIFGACGAVHGGVDIRPFPDHWGMKRHLGEYYENPEVWDEHTVATQLFRIKAGNGVPRSWGNVNLRKMKPHQLAIIIDCGTDDFFFDVNAALHEAMIHNNIVHDYIVRPGVHNSEYGRNAISFQLVFFDNYFTREKQYKAQEQQNQTAQ